MPCVKRATSAWIAKCPVSVRLAPGTKGPRLFLDDTRLEFEHRVANVARKFPVAFAMAHDQQKILPPLRNEVLDERVGKHCPARQQMQKVGAAILAAQPVVLSPSRGGGRSGDLATLPSEALHGARLYLHSFHTFGPLGSRRASIASPGVAEHKPAHQRDRLRQRVWQLYSFCATISPPVRSSSGGPRRRS